MAAVFASLMCQLEKGDKVVSSRALFGSIYQILTKILPKYGIETVLVNGTDLNEWESAIDDKTKAVFFETPSNPTLEIIDIQNVCSLAKKFGAKVSSNNIDFGIKKHVIFVSPRELPGGVLRAASAQKVCFT